MKMDEKSAAALKRLEEWGGPDGRVAEYDFMFQHLKEKGLLLDVGPGKSPMCNELVKLGWDVWAVDINVCPVSKDVKFFQADCRSLPFEDENFDYVTAVSSVQHFGLLCYGNGAFDEDGDVQAMKEIRRVLKKASLLVMTLSYGLGPNESWYRVYNRETLTRLLEEFEVVDIRYYVKVEDEWLVTTEAQCAVAGRVGPKRYNKGLVCVAARRK